MKILTCLLLCFSMFSCSHNITRGSILYDSYLKLLEKQMTKDQIINIIGPPAIISDYPDNNTWYYVARYMKQSSIGKPVLLSQKLLVLNFDQDSLLKEFVFKERDDLPHIMPVSTKIIEEGATNEIIEHFIKNLARFNHSKPRVKKH